MARGRRAARSRPAARPRRRARPVSSTPEGRTGTPARSPPRGPSLPRAAPRERRGHPRAGPSSLPQRARIRRVTEDLVSRSIDLPHGELWLLQPQESAELPAAGGIEWAPIAPYWSVLWRSGVALARELDGVAVRGLRVVELGCGLAVPSIAAARGGATVLATDACAEALPLAARNARLNEVHMKTATVDWTRPAELLRRHHST